MEISKQDRQLIDRYLSDHLTGSELEDFMQRMQADISFRNAITLHAMLQKGIDFSYEHHYKNLVLSSIRYKKPLVPLGLKLIFFFLLITFSGSILWFYLAPDTGSNTPKFSFFENFKSTPPGDSKHKSEKKKIPVNDETVNRTSTTEAGDSANNIAGTETDNILGNDTNATSGNALGDDIVVRKDEMLISAEVPVADLNENKTADAKDDLSNTAVEKLNPAAGLPEQEKGTSATITTEFWVSPINYRGYRFVNNKLILFGIEEPDRVRLYRMKDNLYMSYQNSYYKLYTSEDFLSYQRIRETEVPLAIRSSK